MPVSKNIKTDARSALKDRVKLRPFFPYYGSKWNIARHYPKPDHKLVIEPFAGSAGYSTFYSVDVARLVDLDPIVTGLWEYLINVSPEEILALPNLLEVGDCVDDYKICQEAKWLIGFWLNRGSATPKKTRTSYSARTDKAQLVWGERAKSRIAKQLPYIRRWTVTQGSYEEMRNKKATWLIDPPYIEKGKYYRKSWVNYSNLAEWSTTRKGTVIVCEGQNADWLPFTNMGHFKTSLGKSNEVVYVRNSDEEEIANLELAIA